MEFVLLFTVSINIVGAASLVPLWRLLFWGQRKGFSEEYSNTKVSDSFSLKTFLVECNCNANIGCDCSIACYHTGFISQSGGCNTVQIGRHVPQTTLGSPNQASVQNQLNGSDEPGWLAGASRARLFQEPLISWGSHARSSRWFTENVPKRRGKKNPVSSSCVDKNTSLMGEVRGEWAGWFQMIPLNTGRTTRPGAAQNRKPRFTHSPQLDNRWWGRKRRSDKSQFQIRHLPMELLAEQCTMSAAIIWNRFLGHNEVTVL